MTGSYFSLKNELEVSTLNRVSSNWIRQISFAMILLCGGIYSEPVVSAADKSNDLDNPLVVINAASMQRLRDVAGTMFGSVDSADMTDRLDQWITGTLKDTVGLDRSRPFGMMLYLRPEMIGPPLGISYLPVTNLDEALLTLSNGVGTIVPLEGKQNRHEIQYTENFKIRTLYRSGYLFLVGPDGTDSSLDRSFPDPEKLTARMSSQYDIAVSLMINSIPVRLKTTFLAYFTTQSKADLQQRDDEPESAYRLRRANGEFWIELIEKVVNNGQELTIGARMDLEKKIASIDVEIAGTRDSKLAKFFQNMAGKRTYFGNLLAKPATFTMSLSWLLEEKQRGLFVKYFDAARRDLGEKTDKGDLEGLAIIADPIFKTLATSAEVGHVDAIAQLIGMEKGEFALIAGVKLATSRELPSQIADLLQFVQDNSNGNELLQKLELGFDTIDSHPVHRLPVNPPDKGGQRLFGQTAHLYMYTSPQAIWLSFGGDEALLSLKEAVQAVGLPQDVSQNRNRVPFLFVTHAKNWLSVTDEENPRAVSFTELAQPSFESDNDAMKLEIRPTESGVRIRAEFESGFIALLGRGISKGVESGFFNDPPTGDRQGQRGDQKRPEPAQQ